MDNIRTKMDVYGVYRMCNDKEYFTCGSNEQYDRMFDMVKANEDWRKIAIVIWICSSTNFELRDIENEIIRRFDVA